MAVDGMDALRKLAAISASRTSSATGPGVHYLRTRGWYLTSTQALVGETLQHVEARFEEVDREVWIADDGSGLVEESCNGRSSDVSGRYAPGRFGPSRSFVDLDLMVAEMRARGRSPLRILADLWFTRAVTPALHARTLDALASPGSATCAPVVDRLGRGGLAVAAEEAALQMASRYVVVLSEQTGDLLAVEEVALDPADWLPKDPPCTVSYTAFVTSGPVASMGTRPTAALGPN